MHELQGDREVVVVVVVVVIVSCMTSKGRGRGRGVAEEDLQRSECFKQELETEAIWVP